MTRFSPLIIREASSDRGMIRVRSTLRLVDWVLRVEIEEDAEEEEVGGLRCR